jgi:hypothetical protein
MDASMGLFFDLLSPPKQLLMDKRVGLKRYELDGRKVLFYFDEVSPAVCVDRVAQEECLLLGCAYLTHLFECIA